MSHLSKNAFFLVNAPILFRVPGCLMIQCLNRKRKERWLQIIRQVNRNLEIYAVPKIVKLREPACSLTYLRTDTPNTNPPAVVANDIAFLSSRWVWWIVWTLASGVDPIRRYSFTGVSGRLANKRRILDGSVGWLITHKGCCILFHVLWVRWSTDFRWIGRCSSIQWSNVAVSSSIWMNFHYLDVLIEVVDNPHLVIWAIDMVLNYVGIWVTDHVFLCVPVSIVRELHNFFLCFGQEMHSNQDGDQSDCCHNNSGYSNDDVLPVGAGFRRMRHRNGWLLFGHLR